MRYRNYYLWKAVDGVPRKTQRCPRCNNVGSFKFVWDCETYILWHPVGKFYAYKCPTCPHVEPVTDELAEALIRGSK